MNWLEVTVVVNGELAEAVADVLARFAYSGVMMEQGVKYTDEEETQGHRQVRSPSVRIWKWMSRLRRSGRNSKSHCIIWG